MKKSPPLLKDVKLCEKAANEMTPFLEQLYYGNIKPGLLKNSPVYQDLVVTPRSAPHTKKVLPSRSTPRAGAAHSSPVLSLLHSTHKTRNGMVSIVWGL